MNHAGLALTNAGKRGSTAKVSFHIITHLDDWTSRQVVNRFRASRES